MRHKVLSTTANRVPTEVFPDLTNYENVQLTVATRVNGAMQRIHGDGQDYSALDKAESLPSGIIRNAIGATPSLSRRRYTRDAGLSTVDLALGILIAVVLLVVALPPVASATKTYNLLGAARTIASQASVARMRAAADFTQVRLNVNTAEGTYSIDVCTTKNIATGGCTTFTTEGGIQTLPPGISFGYGTISTPAGTQSPISQIAPFLFNSRGVTIDPTTLAPTGNDGVYLKSTSGKYYAVTASASGRIAVWRYDSTGWTRA